MDFESLYNPGHVRCGCPDATFLPLFQASHPDLCFCGCHHTGTLHFRSCCHPCPGCGQRIDTGRIEYHREQCPGVAALARVAELEAILAERDP